MSLINVTTIIAIKFDVTFDVKRKEKTLETDYRIYYI